MYGCLLFRLFETLQSLFWSIFGLISLYVTNVKPEHEFTEYVGSTMFGTYNVISLVVLLNMLIAMMNNSYQHIADHADIEWKFARTKLWMSYFEEGGTLPSPFNIIPSPKSFYYLFCWIKRQLLRKPKIKRLETFETLGRRAAENVRLHHEYQEVLRSLVKRYVAAMIRDAKTEEGLTEENFKELKQDISSFRFEVLGMMKGKSQRGVASKVASSTLAYPGNSFTYSPKISSAEPQQKLNMTTTILQSRIANTTSSEGSNKEASGSVVLSSTEQPHSELSKDVSEAGPIQRRNRLPSQKCDEIYTLLEEDTLGPGEQNPKQHHTEKIIVEVLQKVETDIQKIQHSCKEHATAKNGPKNSKN